MLSNKTPFKSFSRALVDGVFLISHGGEYTPPPPPADFYFVVDDANNYLIDNSGDFLVTDVTYYMVDDAHNELIDNSGNFLIQQQ
jgi:hypothetical protein